MLRVQHCRARCHSAAAAATARPTPSGTDNMLGNDLHSAHCPETAHGRGPVACTRVARGRGKIKKLEILAQKALCHTSCSQCLTASHMRRFMFRCYFLLTQRHRTAQRRVSYCAHLRLSSTADEDIFRSRTETWHFVKHGKRIAPAHLPRLQTCEPSQDRPLCSVSIPQMHFPASAVAPAYRPHILFFSLVIHCPCTHAP